MTRRLLRNWFGKPAPEKVEVRKPEAQSSAPAILWIEKRRERRVPANELARIHSLEYRSDAISCRILETSRSGLRISADLELSPGTIIQLFTARSIIMAEVRHCSRAEDSFLIGLAIDNVIEIPRFDSSNKSGSSLATPSLSEL